MFQGGQPLAHQPGLLAQRLALRVRPGARQQRLGTQPVAELARGIAPQLEPLDRAPQPVERRGRAIAAPPQRVEPGGPATPAPRRGGELLLDAVALREQRLEPLARVLALEARR